MTIPKLLVLLALLLLVIIGVAAWWKKEKKTDVAKPIIVESQAVKPPIEIDIDAENATAPKQIVSKRPPKLVETELPSADRIDEFFNKSGAKFPFVETITYRSRVPWQKGRPAWLSDYASHYATSRHFIARSLNGKRDYFKQDVAEGDRFNILKPDSEIQFQLIIDTSRCRMWFYVADLKHKTRTLVKDYTVGLGREDTQKASGLLTPHGLYQLGSKIAIYKPTMMGWYGNQKVEMISIFGSRWIPFDQEMNNAPSTKGLGIHGLPWKRDAKGDVSEERSSLGQYASDGCVRLATEDMEELFAVVITRPTIVELVKDFNESTLQR